MVFVGSDPFLSSMDLFRKKVFSVFRGFDPYRRRDGSVLEGTICKQFVSNAKNRKNLKPCRGFKSFRSLAFRIQLLKKCVFGSSNPSTRRKINGISAHKTIGLIPFARSATSLGVSPHHCEAHHLHGVQHRSFVSALRRNDVELTLK